MGKICFPSLHETAVYFNRVRFELNEIGVYFVTRKCLIVSTCVVEVSYFITVPKIK